MAPRNDKISKAAKFNELYVDYFRRCNLYARSYLQDQLQSEDVASEALMKLWENWDDSYSDIQRKAFLLTTVRNRCLDHLRKQQLSLKTQDCISETMQRELAFRISLLESTDPQELFIADIQRIVDETLEKLPKQTQLIFQLSRMEGKGSAEIAKTLGLSVKAIEYHITKALTILRKQLKDYLPAILFLYF